MQVYKSSEKIAVGEIFRGKEIGKTTRPYAKFIWSQCPTCKIERWVEIKESLKQTGITLCSTCSGRLNGRLASINRNRRT